MSSRDKFAFPTSSERASVPGADPAPDTTHLSNTGTDFNGNAVNDAREALTQAEEPDAARRERIAREAWRVAEERGFPPDSDLDNWLEAEKRLGLRGNSPLSIGPT